MSEMTPLDAGFDLSIRGFGQASGGARARRGNNRQGFDEQSSDEDYVDDDGEDTIPTAISIPATAITLG